MARPTKQDYICFPLWNPHYRNEERFFNTNRAAYKALRESSSAFIKKIDLVKLIKTKCGNRCVFCGSQENLQIDHIITVYQAFKKKEYISILNTYDNLQILCRSCNSAKSQDGDQL